MEVEDDEDVPEDDDDEDVPQDDLDVDRMTVDELKSELKKRGVTFPKSAQKKDLTKLLKENLGKK